MNTHHPLHRAILPTGRFWVVIMMVTALLLMSGSTPVLAQEGQGILPISLRDDEQSYNLESSLFILRDPTGTMTYAQALEHYRNGTSGQVARGSVVSLGSRPVPHWLIVPLSNESLTESWMLQLGAPFSGRLGQVRELLVYDDVSRTRFIDTVNSEYAQISGNVSMPGQALPVRLARGKKAVLVMYVMPEAGMPVLISPRLTTAHHYMQKSMSSMMPQRLLGSGIMIMIGFFVGSILLRRSWGDLVFVAYYLLLLGLFRLQAGKVLVDYSFASELSCILLALAVVAGIFGARVFLDIKRFYIIQSRAISIAVAALVLSVLSGSLVLSEGILLKPIIMLVPPVLGMLFIVALALAQAQSGKHGANQFAAAWIFATLGALVTGVSMTGLFPSSALMVAGFWFGLIPQALLFVTASVTRVVMMERDEINVKREMEDEAESISQLKQSRDASENARLLRVIEHERQVMNELREREIKQSEDMRYARDAADEANRAKSAFLAVISHEIRTPMSGVMGMVRLLLETKLSKEQKDYAQTIQDSGDAMLSLLNDILDFEKIESGKMDLEHIDFDIHRLIQGIVTLMSGHADAKSIILKQDIDPGVPRYIMGDPVRLRQVLLNLVGNSIKFTERGGVTIHIKLEPGGGDTQGTVRLRFAVQDTGVGISREAQKALFNPFAQADNSVARRFGGTGLGLAISQRLIEAMGGHIAIDSAEGRGSTFYFTLAVLQGSSSAVESASLERASPITHKPDRLLRILVVEDNQISQKLMREFIQRLGHETVIAGSGEDAIARAERESFDVILMDVELPGISGMGATRSIRALRDPQKAAVPVIAMTGNVRDDDIHSCYAANMNGHLGKPIDPQKLREALQKVIDKRLDNPVVVGDGGGELRQLQENEIKMSIDSLAAASTLNLEDGPAAAPIRELLVTAEELSLEDDDMEGDSFAEAIQQAQSDEDDRGAIVDDSGVFDDSMLKGLRGGLSSEAIKQLVDELFAKAEEIIGDLNKASNGRDIAALSARAHELKGMAANFGLVEVSRLAEKAERAAKDNTFDGVPQVLADLEPAHGRAKAALRRWINR